MGSGIVESPEDVARELNEEGGFEVQVAGDAYSIKAQLGTCHDPNGEILRGRGISCELTTFQDPLKGTLCIISTGQVIPKLARTARELINDRARLLGPNVSTFYDDPVHFVKGEGVWLWDAGGRKYLDCYNNVPHVGHCNPRVVEAICRQAGTLNTHSRYLHDGIIDYVERLTGTMAPSLNTAILTCTGSEANDIALRMAEAVTGNRGIIATDATYHGNTSLVSQLSRSNPPAVGFGLDQYLRFVEAPDSYRRPDPRRDAFCGGRGAQDRGGGTGRDRFCRPRRLPLFPERKGFPTIRTAG